MKLSITDLSRALLQQGEVTLCEFLKIHTTETEVDKKKVLIKIMKSKKL